MPNNVLTGLHSRITEYSHATLVTAESCGSLRAAQITNPYLDSEGRLWCFVATTSFVVDNIEACPDALLLWPQSAQSISVSARGFVITNGKIKQSIWTHANWPGAAIDPLSGEVVLICFTVRRIEYWDTQTQRRVCHVLPRRLAASKVTNSSGALSASH